MANSTSSRPDFVQLRNPRTDRYTKIDRERGVIVSQKRSAGPYKGVRIVTPTENKGG